MDKHTFIGKRKVGSTDVCDFTDYQGIGHDPLYKRYDSVYSVVKRHVDPKYAHFLAIPNYASDEDVINWYIDEWKDIPARLVELEGEDKAKYESIKTQTIVHYRGVLSDISGEELQLLACALKYIDDEFIYCCDGKVFVLAWGMTPNTNKHISKGELVHEAPSVTRHELRFDAGEHGQIASKIGANVKLAEGTVISQNNLPTVKAEDGYVFKGWEPNPIGIKVDKPLNFTAVYEVAPPTPPVPFVPPVIPPEPAESNMTYRFDGGENGIVNGAQSITKPRGSRLMPNEVPTVTPKKGYTFKGWNADPCAGLLNNDRVFTANYEKKLPWYKRFWLWLTGLFTGSGCLKWLLWALLALLIAMLLSWLLRGCHGCSRDVNGVGEADRIVTAAGDTIDNNGVVHPIDLDNGRLPDESNIVAPIHDEDGVLPPIVREPGVPPNIGNRLFLFLENENDNIDSFAEDFKKAYPGDQYSIIGFDRDVKSLLIQIPEAEKETIRKTINSKIPNHKFIVFDEEIYELNGHLSTTSAAPPGWHLNAIKVKEGWKITKGSPSVTVAVIDDGIDASHPIFKDRIVAPYNVYTQNNKLSVGEGHGTHTAGLAVGSSEFIGQGASGVAPSCKLMPVQVIDNGMCPLSALVSGVMYAIHKDADVVNISIGPSFQGLNQLPVEAQDQIARTQFKNVEKLWTRVCKIAVAKKTILVFAAGNDDILSSIPPENRSSVAITVGAVDQKLYPTDFTNYGSCTDISAPGSEIYSSFPTRSFRSCDGTSMSAPIVSGTVALMKSLKKDLTVEQARNVLYRTGQDVYGNMPPMVQVNLALDAVKKGDFSAPKQRAVRPVPGIGNGATPPSSWADGTEIVVNDGPVVVVADESTAEPAQEKETDYEAIRRLIAEYEQKIKELKGQLPENKK